MEFQIVSECLCCSERQKVKACSEKILKWKDQVSDRVRVLGKRVGSESRYVPFDV